MILLRLLLLTTKTNTSVRAGGHHRPLAHLERKEYMKDEVVEILVSDLVIEEFKKDSDFQEGL
jgi:hypothetical protein